MSYRHNRINKPPRLSQQRGVVVVVALFIVALVAAMSYILLSRLQRDTERTTLILRNVEGEFLAQGSIAWAMDTLRDNFEKSRPNERVDILPINSSVSILNGFSIHSVIYDMQSRFNLNTLESPDNLINFKRLILTVYPNFTEEKAQEVASAILDWRTKKPPEIQNNIWDQYYLERLPPYRASHRPFFSASELRLVKGVTPELYKLLEPYVTALPEKVYFNITTAPAPVIMTWSPKLTLSSAKTLQDLFTRATNISKEAFANNEVIVNNQLPLEKVAWTSSYFLVETVVTIEDQTLLIYTLLERGSKNGKPDLRIIWQSKGIW